MRQLLTARQVAELLCISPKTVYNLAASGTLPCVRLSPRVVRFDPDRLEQWVKDQGRYRDGMTGAEVIEQVEKWMTDPAFDAPQGSADDRGRCDGLRRASLRL